MTDDNNRPVITVSRAYGSPLWCVIRAAKFVGSSPSSQVIGDVLIEQLASCPDGAIVTHVDYNSMTARHGGPPLRVLIDADCPLCGWPERWYDPKDEVHGCPKCPHLTRTRG